ncbi:Myb- protein A [Tritrichomonas musculus]|uniref:Myb- protein A n=1 Tax=Tritrichomonas musculus TaxID=1915356 RepID=A0ABR2H9R5_9EUKA
MNFLCFNCSKLYSNIDLNVNNLSSKPVHIQRSYSRVHWTKEENEKIINLVEKFGPRNWKKIAEEIKTKTAQQCRDHYNDVLDPKINKTIWTNEEERIMLLKYEQLGPQWAKIKTFLPGRTTGMIKNHISVLLKSRSFQKEESNIRFHKDLSNDFVEKNCNFSYHNIQCFLNNH